MPAKAGVSAEHAALYVPDGRSVEDLVAGLLSDVKGAGERPELTWSEQIKTLSPDQYRARAKERLLSADATGRETADWFAAFGSELAPGRDGKIEKTPFDMSVARQKFLADARKLAAGLAEDRSGRKIKTSAEAYREALFGPWMYEDDQHSLGWDPSTMKLGAFSYKEPTAMANSGVRAAVWLAFESLPLFPCFYADRLEVRAFQYKDGEFALCWPTWRRPISLAALVSLLGWRELTADVPDPAQLRGRGVTSLYRSARFKPNKYLASFRAPELVFGAAG